LCTNKKLYRASAGLYADAFGADPKLANDLKAGHRYNTACHASLAAAEQGEDAAKPDRLRPCALRSDTPTQVFERNGSRCFYLQSRASD
jgi:hypothetical protein